MNRALLCVALGLSLSACDRAPMTDEAVDAAVAKCRARGGEPYALHQHADSGPTVGIECVAAPRSGAEQ